MGAGNVIQNAMDKLFLDKLSQNNVDNAKQNALILREIKEQHDDELLYHAVDNEFYGALIEKIDEISEEHKLAQVASGKQNEEISSIIEASIENMTTEEREANNAITALLGNNAQDAIELEQQKTQSTALVAISDSTKKIATVLDKNRQDAKAEKTAGLINKQKVAKTVTSTKSVKKGFDMKLFMGGLFKILRSLLNPVAFVTAFIMSILPWVLIIGAFIIGVWSKLSKTVKAKILGLLGAILAVWATIKAAFTAAAKALTSIVSKVADAAMNTLSKGAGAAWNKLKKTLGFGESEQSKILKEEAKNAKEKGKINKSALADQKKEAVMASQEHTAVMANEQKKAALNAQEHSQKMITNQQAAAKDAVAHSAKMGSVAKENVMNTQAHAAKMATAQTGLLNTIKEHVLAMFAWVKKIALDALAFLKDLAVKAFEMLLAGLKAVAEFAKIAFQIMLSVSVYILIALAVVAIILIFAGLLILIFKAIGWIIKEVIGVIKEIFQAIIDIFGPLIKTLMEIIITIAIGIAMIAFWPYIIIGLLGATIFKILKSVLDSVVKVLTNVIEKTIGALIEGMEPVFETLGAILKAVFSVFKLLIPAFKFIGKVIGLIVDLIGAIFEVILEPIKIVFNILKDVILSLIPIFQGIGDILKPIVMVIGVVFQAVGGILSAIGSVIGEVLEPLMDILMPLVSVIKGLLKFILLPLRIVMKIFGAIMKIIGKIFDIFGTLLDAIFMPIAAVIEFVTGLIEAVVKVIGGVLAVLMSPFKWLMSLFGGGDDEEEKKKEDSSTGPISTENVLTNDKYNELEQAKLAFLGGYFDQVLTKLDGLNVSFDQEFLNDILNSMASIKDSIDNISFNDSVLNEMLTVMYSIDTKLDNLNAFFDPITEAIYELGVISVLSIKVMVLIGAIVALILVSLIAITAMIAILLFTIFSPFMLLMGGLGTGIGLLGGLFSRGLGGDSITNFFNSDEDEPNIEDIWKEFMQSVQKDVHAIKEVIAGKDAESFVSNLYATNESTSNSNSTSYAELSPTDSVEGGEMEQPDVNINVGAQTEYGGAFGEMIKLLRTIAANTGAGGDPAVFGV